MSTENTTATAAPVQPTFVNVNINGVPLRLEQVVGTTGKKLKGKPVLLPAFKGKVPDVSEVVTYIKALGEEPILTKLGQLFKSITVNASVDAIVQDPATGKYSNDTGKFVTLVGQEVRELVSSAKALAQEKLDALVAEFNKIMAEECLPAMKLGKAIAPETVNRIMQNQSAQAELKKQLEKKAPAPATAAASK